MKGTVRFDIDNGRIDSQLFEVDKRVLGFAGPTSSMHYVMRMEEKFTDAKLVASTPLKELSLLKKQTTLSEADQTTPVVDDAATVDGESTTVARRPTFASATLALRQPQQLRQADKLPLSRPFHFVHQHHVVHAGGHFVVGRAGRQMRAADDHDPVALLRAADAAGPVVGVLDQLLHVGRRRIARAASRPNTDTSAAASPHIGSRPPSARSCDAATRRAPSGPNGSPPPPASPSDRRPSRPAPRTTARVIGLSPIAEF